MRQRLIEADLVEAVIGLGANLFHNSPMEACILACRTTKPQSRRGRILFIDAVREVARERGQSALKPKNIARIISAYRTFTNEQDFASVVANEDIILQGSSLSIPLYVKCESKAFAPARTQSAAATWKDWEASGRIFWQTMDSVANLLEELESEEALDA